MQMAMRLLTIMSFRPIYDDATPGGLLPTGTAARSSASRNGAVFRSRTATCPSEDILLLPGLPGNPNRGTEAERHVSAHAIQMKGGFVRDAVEAPVWFAPAGTNDRFLRRVAALSHVACPK